MRTKKSFSLLCAVVLSFSVMPVFAACGGDSGSDNNDQYEFVFDGSGVFNDGVDYHVRIVGNKDDERSLQLSVKEMPALKMTGKWVLVENKGYKLYFDDSSGTFAYARYDDKTQEFTIKYSLNLGGGQGNGKVILTCKDESFAKEYDGIGLPPLPPTFKGWGWNGTNRLDCVLYCYEDGTCVSVTDRAGVPDWYGTYIYDAEKNQYSFTFNDERDIYPPNYTTTLPDGSVGYRLDYCVFRGDNPSKGNYRATLPAENGLPPAFNTGCYWFDENGERHDYDFVTTYDDETRTYTLYYEAYSKGFQNRCVTYTVED